MANTWRSGDDQGRKLALAEQRKESKEKQRDRVMVIDGLTGKRRMQDA